LITGLRVANFKRFAELSLPFRPMTVLSGMNGAGKSTIVQALLLARQVADRPDRRVVQLNGEYGLALGEALEVLYVDASQPEIVVELTTETGVYSYGFGVPEDSRRLNLSISDSPPNHPEILAARGLGFTYLSAERLGPRDQLNVSAEEERYIEVGVQGEFTGQAISLHETSEVRPPLRFPAAEEQDIVTLRTQLEYWASAIIRPVQISANWPAGITASIIRFQDPNVVGEPIRPANMGFGFSYALPVLVAGLLIPVGGLLVVENPEAHLHPAGQSKLGRFLARVAGSGAQVLVETHSDHVLNGIRLGAVEDRVVAPDDVLIHFLDGAAEPRPITVNSRGEFSEWPQGFFDQFDDDLERLSRVRRARQ